MIKITREDVCDMNQVFQNNDYLDQIIENIASGRKIRFAKDATDDSIAFLHDLDRGFNSKPSAKEIINLAHYAAKKGATQFVSTEDIEGYPCIVVKNVFQAFVDVCSKYRKNFEPATVGVTGSMGKTTTSRMIYNILIEEDQTLNGSILNSTRYVGYVIQRLKKFHNFYVQEIAEAPPLGLASRLSKMVKPNIAVITKIGSGHLGDHGTKESIAESCFGITDGMSSDGILFINSDDELQRDFKVKTKIITYGIYKKSDYQAINIKFDNNKIFFDITYNRRRENNIQLNCIGEHNVYNALASFAVAKELGISSGKIKLGLLSFKTGGVRQNFTDIGGYNLYLDCASATPESFQSGFDAFEGIPVSAGSKKLAVIGAVQELGKQSEDVHAEIGKQLSKYNLDTVICWGGRNTSAKIIADILKEHSDIEVLYSDDYLDCRKIILDKINLGDLIYFKGARKDYLSFFIDDIFGTNFSRSMTGYLGLSFETAKDDLLFLVFPRYASIKKGLTNKTSQVIIPSLVEQKPLTIVENHAFRLQDNLVEVRLPDSILHIGLSSFYRCRNLKKITLSKNLLKISRSSFNSCTSLEEVTLGDRVMDIGYKAFINCKKLRQIYIPKSVGKIGKQAFEKCPSLTLIIERNSYAEIYAKENELPFVYIDPIIAKQGN